MSVAEVPEYLPFEPEKHLSGVITLCKAEGWESLASSPERMRRSFTAPGVSTVVAVCGGNVVGFAVMQGDGVLQAHLSLISVDRCFRRRGIGRRLVEEVFARCGAERVDLISSEGSETFYESFSHRLRRGYRIYPGLG